MTELRAQSVPEVPPSLLPDPTAPFFGTPVLSALVSAYARQVELHMLEKMRDSALECAPFLRKQPSFRAAAAVAVT